MHVVSPDKTTTENKRCQQTGKLCKRSIHKCQNDNLAQLGLLSKCKCLILYDQVIQQQTIINDDKNQGATEGENSTLFMKIL